MGFVRWGGLWMALSGCGGDDPGLASPTDSIPTTTAASTADTASTASTASTADTASTASTADSTSTARTGDTGAACLDAGCLVSWTSLGRFPRADLQALVDPRVVVENGYEVFVVEYRTEGGRTATGTITLPFDTAAPMPTAGWPVVVNAHGTIGVADACRLSGTVSGSGLAGLFGARGAIGVAPDYIGLGGPGDHDYLELYDEAVAVLDAIRAAQHLADAHGVARSGRSAVVGLSQGGHAVLGAATWHSRYAPELDIRAFGASGPASLYAEQWSGGVGIPGTHMALHALVAWSFARRAGVDDTPLWAAGFDPVPHLSARCGWDPSFQGAPTLYDDFPVVADQVFSGDYLAAYQSGTFAGFDVVAEGFDRNRVRPWLDVGTQTAPVVIWQGVDDVVVPAGGTVEMVDDLVAGGIDVTLHLVPGAGHTDTAFGFLASWEQATEDSITWVREQLDASAP